MEDESIGCTFLFGMRCTCILTAPKNTGRKKEICPRSKATTPHLFYDRL